MIPLTRTTRPPSACREDARKSKITRALVVADAGWFTTSSLFTELDREDTAVLLLTCLDWRNAWRRGARPWSWNAPPRLLRDRLWQCDLALPTGWMKRWPDFGMKPIARAVRRWTANHADAAELALVMTYPHYLTLHEQLAPTHSIYLNVDDYRLYWPAQAEKVADIERRAIEKATLTACVAQSRADELARKLPHLASRILHLPHGAPQATIPDSPHACPASTPHDLSAIPGPRLGYVGSLEDRVDWDLLDQLAVHRPDASIVLIGRPEPDDATQQWHRSRARALARPNVRCLGWRDQARIAAYIAAFDVCLIPYDVAHPFNRACNPTKIMDYMGSGRPIVATAVPECRLHANRFHVAENAPQFLAAIDAILAADSDDGRSASRHAYARANSCERTAQRLLDALDRQTTQ